MLGPFTKDSADLRNLRYAVRLANLRLGLNIDKFNVRNLLGHGDSMNFWWNFTVYYAVRRFWVQRLAVAKFRDNAFVERFDSRRNAVGPAQLGHGPTTFVGQALPEVGVA